MDARVASGLFPEALDPIQSLKGCFRAFREDREVTFFEAIQDIHDADIIPDVRVMAEDTYQTASDAKRWGRLKDDPISVDSVAAFMKYSAEDTEPALYKDMNNKCYNRDRTLIQPFLKLMWLMLKSMLALEPYLEPMVYRGVKADLSPQYPKDREVVWHGFCSCTKSMKVLETDQFCGRSGLRTIFNIRLTQGQARDIKQYSLFGADEDEVLLPPGCRFKVMGKMDAGHGLTIVQLEELPSTSWIINLNRPALKTVQLFHGTSEDCAVEIQRDGHIKPSPGGVFGPGVYLTSSMQKAKAWARYAAAGRPNMWWGSGGGGSGGACRSWTLRTTPSRAAVVVVQAEIGRCKTVELNEDQLKVYREVHVARWAEDGGDEFGRAMHIHEDSPQSQEDLASWIREGFDSLFTEETGPFSTVCLHGPKYHRGIGRQMYDELNERISGDEWVLARGPQASYVRHVIVDSADSSSSAS
mmetsp:Transcript_108775/g.208983  ORF Transcript_108775/g.208983 Transcript_108775/m.208983 type:complete len:470 (-) Transcript_108775:52-1461(-)